MIITDYIRHRLVNINKRRIFLYTTLIALISSPFVNVIFHWPVMSSHHHRQRQQREVPSQGRQNIDRYLRVRASGKVSNSTSLTSTSSSLPCDDECLRFGRLLDSWPADKPKAAVIILLGPLSINAFARSSRMFSVNFNDAFSYPVIVFHEQQANNVAYRQQLRSFTNSSLYFQVG